MDIYDYDTLAYRHTQMRQWLPEAYAGTDIVEWYGNIERQLSRFVEENDATRNHVYADKIRQVLKIWRANELSGSINTDIIRVLLASVEVCAADSSWDLDDYFSKLRDQLRKLLASEEELPRPSADNGEQRGGGMGGGSPVMAPAFGGEENSPAGEETPGAEEPLPETPGEPAPGAEEEPKEGEEELPPTEPPVA